VCPQTKAVDYVNCRCRVWGKMVILEKDDDCDDDDDDDER